ncbi:hypothetical protein FRC04_002671 [Tulasnella sp. 424]|nr:hypothetical protein FRC04_002671 [Tulasnella sp. 424]KAG8974181.1 hypothetical protein FRC05_007757 [Tulasnella sp. 425]
MTTSGSELKLFHCLPIPAGKLDDLYDFQAIRMVIVHNIILRGFNSMAYYSGDVEPQTKRFDSFLGYCNEVIQLLHEHHSMEEGMYFPFLENKLGAGAMTDNVDGHDQFRVPLERLEDLIAKLRAGQTPWDVGYFRAVIYDLVSVLREHLAEEIDTLRAWRLKDHITVAELQGFELGLEAHIKAKSSLAKDLQLLYINGDGVHAAWFPKIPLPIALLAKYILWPVHSDWWEFGCCDKNMVVKTQFAPYEPRREDELMTVAT